MAKALNIDQLDLLRRENLSIAKITDQQKAFCEEWVKSFNKLQALKAGNYYTPKHPTGGKQLKLIEKKFQDVMKSKAVQEYIVLLRESVVSRVGFSMDDIVEQYKAMAFARMDDYITWGPDGVRIKSHEELNVAQRAGIMEIVETDTKYGRQIKFKLFDRKSALDRLFEILKELECIEKQDNSPVKISKAQINLILQDPIKRRAVEHLADSLFDKRVSLVADDKDRLEFDQHMEKITQKLLERMNAVHTGSSSDDAIIPGLPAPGRRSIGDGSAEDHRGNEAADDRRDNEKKLLTGPENKSTSEHSDTENIDTEPDRYGIDGI